MSEPGSVTLQRTLYASRNPTRRYLHRSRRDWVLSQLRSLPAVAGRRILEIGPGSGVYLPALTEAGETVVALDREEAYLQAARQLPDEHGVAVYFVQGDLRAPPLAPGSVDVILCSEVIEHVPHSPDLLSALAGLLSRDGVLILTTPQPWSPIELLGRIAFLPGIVHLLRWIYREPIEPTGHINLLSRARLEAQIDAAGLEVVGRDVMGLYLPVVGEFGGERGARWLAGLDRWMRGSPFEALLWTQCYRLRRRC